MDDTTLGQAGELISRITGAAFPVTRLRPGYDKSDVEAFLGTIADALRRGEVPDPARVRDVQFRTTRLASGYDEDEVDRFLDEIERGLQALAPRADLAGGPGTAGMPGPRALTEAITGARFRVTSGAEGYDQREVDLFLDKLAGALSRGDRLDPRELRDVAFPPAFPGAGYARQDVDELLDAIRRQAAARS